MPRHIILHYSFALACVSIAIFARFLLDPILGTNLPFATCYLAVLLTAWYVGNGPSLVVVLLGSLLGVYFFTSPRFSFIIDERPAAFELLFFCGLGICLVRLSKSNRAALENLEREVDDLRHRESMWHEHEEKLRATLDGIGDGVLVADAGGLVTRLNPVAERLVGWRSVEAEGRPVGEVFHLIDEQSRSDIELPLSRIMEEGVVVGLAKGSLLVSRDGSAWPIDDSISPVRNAGSQVVGLVIIFRDVTERRRSERALEASEGRLRLAQEAAQMGTWEYEASTGRVAWSTGLEVMHGLEPGTFVGTFDAFLADIHPEDSARVIETVRLSVQEGRDHFIEYRFLHPEGGCRWVEGRGKLFPDRNGKMARLIGVCLDVTERKRAEEALREADRRKHEFLAILAHELRNPLAPIRTGLQILKHQEIADPLWAMMDRQVEHLTSLIDDLMDVSRISLGKIDLRKEIVKLSSVLDRAVASCLPAIEQRGHRLKLKLPEGDERLEADPTRLEQVLSNLLDNACKYTDPGGDIELDARRESGEIILTVRDTGIGIAAESLDKIFDMFMQIERRLNRSQGGLGIGLCLVKSLVEMHNGTISVRSEGPGRGSEFEVRLPALAGDRKDRPTTSDRPRAIGRHESHVLRILVVDDNQDAANSLAKYLKRVAGHEVEVAYDGPEAVEIAFLFRPEVVVLDIGLPGMSGYEVAEKLRERPETGEARLIALTGWSQEEDRRRSKSAGIDVHLVKPVDLDVILEVLAGAS